MKLQNMVKFPLTGLDMTPHVVKRSQSSWSLPSHWSPWRRPYGLGRDPEDYIYDLYAVCNHHGTMQGGHYTGLQRERPGACADGPPTCCACDRVAVLQNLAFSSSRKRADHEGSFHLPALCSRASSGQALTRAGRVVACAEGWPHLAHPGLAFLTSPAQPRLRFCSASFRA